MVVSTGHQHHAELLPHVEELRLIADSLGELTPAALRERIEKEISFINAQLVPHMHMAEQRLYPVLEQLLEDNHAMDRMRREHADVQRLIGELSAVTAHLGGERIPLGTQLSVRRVLYRLFAIMRVHLQEEELYLPVIEQNTKEPQLHEIADAMQHAPIEPI